MAQQTVNGNSVQPLGGPNTGIGTDLGDSWDTAATKLNAMFTELYGRTGGTSTLTSSAGAFPKNIVDCGDFTTNPWQRSISTNSIAALQYTADRWFVVGPAGATYDILVQSVSTTTNQGFSTSLQFGRANGDTHTSQIYLGQVIESGDSIRAQGQPVTLSFYAAAGSAFAAGSATPAGGINVQLVQGLGTNQSALSLIAGSWTSQSYAINSTISGFATAAYTRYSFTGTVTGTATQLAVLFSYTATGTASSLEYILLQGIQLEIANQASAFEHRDVQIDLEIAQRYYYQITEPAAGVVVATGFANETNGSLFYTALPVQMRAAPTVTFVAGSFKMFTAASSTVSISGAAAGTTHTPNYISLTASGTAISGQGTLLVGGGGSGYVGVSAEF